MASAALQVLQRVFGFSSFRGLQQDVIDHTLSGGDSLVLMPTGGGKSLCYQLPALLRDGTAVVISPLIALMQDQVAALQQAGVRAECLNSALSYGAVRDTEARLRAGALDLLYVAPERLLGERTLALLDELEIALFAIDEAHCVSQWGHDFRPEYLQLSLLHERYPDAPRMALTATADAPTRREIAERLRLDRARWFVSGFDRPNIQYRVALKRSPREQLARLIDTEHRGDAGIVYCLSRDSVDKTAAWLRERGLDALPYHAGMGARDRAANQDRFVRGDGVVIVATIAFGMGIDKPDVRFVAHLNLPKSLEAYYQETGRAGRDGLPATAWMAYGLQDVIVLRQMVDGSEAGADRKRLEIRKLDALLGYCELTTCRRTALLTYFGDQRETPCGNCDNCLSPPESWDATEAARKALSCVYRTGQRFGAAYVVDVLRGRGDDRIRRFGHDRLATFGIGADIDARQWRSVLRQLVARGLLQVDIDGYGGLKLTPAARPVLRGEEVVELRRDTLPAGAARRKRAPAAAGSGPPALFDALRARRRDLAQEQSVPPYVIFHDSTLQAMAAEQPGTLDEMEVLPGIGAKKLERYGEIFLRVIREYRAGSTAGGDAVATQWTLGQAVRQKPRRTWRRMPWIRRWREVAATTYQIGRPNRGTMSSQANSEAIPAKALEDFKSLLVVCEEPAGLSGSDIDCGRVRAVESVQNGLDGVAEGFVQTTPSTTIPERRTDTRFG